jgi:hypothetical protein
VRLEKKLRLKKNCATIHDSVLLWEELRLKTTSKEQKAALVAEIMKKVCRVCAVFVRVWICGCAWGLAPYGPDHGGAARAHTRTSRVTPPPPLCARARTQVKGNVPALANHHSGSRVIQWCLKDGRAADRAALAAEVRACVVPLSKSKYGRFVVQKLISVADKGEVPGAPGEGALVCCEVCGGGGLRRVCRPCCYCHDQWWWRPSCQRLACDAHTTALSFSRRPRSMLGCPMKPPLVLKQAAGVC